MTGSFQKNSYHLIILGAGASGLICAAEAAGRGLSVLLIDHRKHPAEKLLASGGEACNITNREVTAENYRSGNPHFCRSALSRFGPADVRAYFARGGMEYEERDHGRIFTRNGAEAVLRFLMELCRERGVQFAFGLDPGMPEYREGAFTIKLEGAERGARRGKCEGSDHSGVDGRSGRKRVVNPGETVSAPHLVIALGSPVRPDLGGSDFGHRIARSFGHRIISPEAALTRLRWPGGGESCYASLSGISLPVTAACEGGKSFSDELLFAHRGISGPAAFQLSLWWQPGLRVEIDLLPGFALRDMMEEWRRHQPTRQLRSLLSELLPRRMVDIFLRLSVRQNPGAKKVAELSNKEMDEFVALFKGWSFIPSGRDGKIAEVSSGGVDTNQISSKNFESKLQPGLYFIGEVLDVTGELGGYNLQWAWSSGWCVSHTFSKKKYN